MLNQLTGYKDRSLDVEACKAMAKGAEVLMLTKVTDKLLVLRGQVVPIPFIDPLRPLTEAHPSCINNAKVGPHVVD